MGPPAFALVRSGQIDAFGPAAAGCFLCTLVHVHALLARGVQSETVRALAQKSSLLIETARPILALGQALVNVHAYLVVAVHLKAFVAPAVVASNGVEALSMVPAPAGVLLALVDVSADVAIKSMTSWTLTLKAWFSIDTGAT